MKEFYLKKGNIETYKIKTRVVSHYVTVDENDHQFQDLLKEVSYEDLERRTLENNEAVRQDFRIAFDNYAKENGLYNYAENPITKTEVITSNIDKMVFEYDGSSKEDKEELIKLYAGNKYLEDVYRNFISKDEPSVPRTLVEFNTTLDKYRNTKFFDVFPQYRKYRR